MALNQYLTGTDLFINPLRNLTNFFRHFFFKLWLSLELPCGINLPLVTSTKVTVFLIFNKLFVVSFLYRRTKNLKKRYIAPSTKLRSSVGNGGVRFPVKERIGSHQQIYEVHFFTFGKVVLSYWTNNKALCHIYDVLPTLGGSLTDDKIFNESSIPNDWAKERASESPHICLREKTRSHMFNLTTFRWKTKRVVLSQLDSITVHLPKFQLLQEIWTWLHCLFHFLGSTEIAVLKIIHCRSMLRN